MWIWLRFEHDDDDDNGGGVAPLYYRSFIHRVSFVFFSFSQSRQARSCVSVVRSLCLFRSLPTERKTASVEEKGKDSNVVVVVLLQRR